MRQIRFPVFAALVLAFVTAPLAALDPRARPTPPAAAANAVDFAAPDANVPRVVANLRDEAPGTDLEGKARFVLDRRASELGLTADSTLELHAIRNGKAVDVVRFRQMAAGLPVLRGAVAVSFNHRGEAIFIANDLAPLRGDAASLSAASAVVPANAARDHALSALGVRGPLHFDRTELAVFPGADRARVVWVVRVEPSSAPHGDWEAIVDAESGELLRLEDRAFYGGTGQGYAYLPDPLSSALATYGDPGYVDGADANTPELLAEIFEVTLPDLTFESGLWRLKGPYAECVDWDTPFIACAADDNGDFTEVAASRSSDVFEDQLVYHHIDFFMRYMNVTLGVPVDPFQYAGGVQYDPHGFNGADNSSYSSGTGRLRFGDGGVDDAEDPDVVIHELGHGIHDWVTNGGLSQVQGLSEGTGDYLAVSYSRTFPGQWVPANPQYNWVFSWDGHNPFWSGRVTTWNDNHLYPTHLTGQIHTDGQFWASCNIDIAELIGYDEQDTAFLEGLSMTGGGTNQAQAAQAVIQAAEALLYPSSTISTMANIYNDSSGGFGCNYGVVSDIFIDGFNSGNTGAWSATVIEP